MRLLTYVVSLGLILGLGCSKAPPEQPPHEPVKVANSDPPTIPNSRSTRVATEKYWQELARIVQQPPSSSLEEYAKASFETSDKLAKLDQDRVDEETLKLGTDIAGWFNEEGRVAVRLRKMSEESEAVLKNEAAGEPGLTFLKSDLHRELTLIMSREDQLFDQFYFQPRQLMDRASPLLSGTLLNPTPEDEDLRNRDDYLKGRAVMEWKGKPLLGKAPVSLMEVWAENRLRLATLIYDHADRKRRINEGARVTWEKLKVKYELPKLPAIGEGLMHRKYPKVQERGGGTADDR